MSRLPEANIFHFVARSESPITLLRCCCREAKKMTCAQLCYYVIAKDHVPDGAAAGPLLQNHGGIPDPRGEGVAGLWS